MAFDADARQTTNISCIKVFRVIAPSSSDLLLGVDCHARTDDDGRSCTPAWLDYDTGVAYWLAYRLTSNCGRSWLRVQSQYKLAVLNPTVHGGAQPDLAPVIYTSLVYMVD